MTGTTPAGVIDLLSVANYVGSQPHDQFAWLREHDPVHFHPEPNGPGFWAVTRYDDVRAVGRDFGRFSSSPTIMLQDSERDPDPDHTMMLMADPPLHTRMRRMVNREFTPRGAARLTDRVAELATQIVDVVADQGRCDLVNELAGKMPSYVIAEILGIPLEDGRDLYRHTEMLHSSTEVVSVEAKAAAFQEMFTYSAEVYAAKKADPADDLASLLAGSELDGRPADEMDFFLWFLLLVDAGGDTTRNLVGAGMHALLQHPDQLALLRSDVDRYLPTAIEELLRWVSPVIYMRRTATADTELAGQAIAAGDKVVMYYGSANRDPACVPDPDRFDITRTANPHVAFGGGGPHFCLGAHLARIEIGALLREILVRLDDLTIDGEVRWMDSNFIFGPTTMPVAFTTG